MSGIEGIGRFMIADRRPHGHWLVKNRRGVFLGTVELEPRWRQHVFVPVVGAVFSWDCLRDLSEFVHKVNIDGPWVESDAKKVVEATDLATGPEVLR